MSKETKWMQLQMIVTYHPTTHAFGDACAMQTRLSTGFWTVASAFPWCFWVPLPILQGQPVRQRRPSPRPRPPVACSRCKHWILFFSWCLVGTHHIPLPSGASSRIHDRRLWMPLPMRIPDPRPHEDNPWFTRMPLTPRIGPTQGRFHFPACLRRRGGVPWGRPRCCTLHTATLQRSRRCAACLTRHWGACGRWVVAFV